MVNDVSARMLEALVSLLVVSEGIVWTLIAMHRCRAIPLTSYSQKTANAD